MAKDKVDRLRECNKCGWVAFGVTRRFANAEVKKFNAFFDTLSPEKQQECYSGKGATIEQYATCHRCGESYKNFRPCTYAKADSIYGCTLNPIIVK